MNPDSWKSKWLNPSFDALDLLAELEEHVTNDKVHVGYDLAGGSPVYMSVGTGKISIAKLDERGQPVGESQVLRGAKLTSVTLDEAKLPAENWLLSPQFEAQKKFYVEALTKMPPIHVDIKPDVAPLKETLIEQLQKWGAHPSPQWASAAPHQIIDDILATKASYKKAAVFKQMYDYPPQVAALKDSNVYDVKYGYNSGMFEVIPAPQTFSNKYILPDDYGVLITKAATYKCVGGPLDGQYKELEPYAKSITYSEADPVKAIGDLWPTSPTVPSIHVTQHVYKAEKWLMDNGTVELILRWQEPNPVVEKSYFKDTGELF